jgi:hypothetical protein
VAHGRLGYNDLLLLPSAALLLVLMLCCLSNIACKLPANQGA